MDRPSSTKSLFVAIGVTLVLILVMAYLAAASNSYQACVTKVQVNPHALEGENQYVDSCSRVEPLPPELGEGSARLRLQRAQAGRRLAQRIVSTVGDRDQMVDIGGGTQTRPY